jgi:uncharacterized damage-inducible protein DinB
MNILSLIAQHVIDVTEGGNWTDVNIADTIRDISVEEANRRTPASPNTIASLLYHLSYWNRVMMQRMKGVKVAVPESNGFDVPELRTDHDWGNLKNDLFDSSRQLAEAIRAFDETKLMDPILPEYSSVYKNLQGTVEHLHYHLGQIVILKKLVKKAEEIRFA